MDTIRKYFEEARQVIDRIDPGQVEAMLNLLCGVREQGGRLFILGVGGSAGNASHAVNDFRKICGFEAYAPTDNVSELTARINDDGWDDAYARWLEGSRLSARDCLMILSVGGGNAEKKVSTNLVAAIKLGKKTGAKICGIVGRDGGYTAREADACVLIPTVNDATVTPHAEAFQAVVWHLLVSHPKMQKFEMKWESTK